jgi:hypothetical protein
MTGLRAASQFFIIIGAMKAGTTSVFRWLGTVPGVVLPSIKEPNFFGDEDTWLRGFAWYESLFEHVSEGGTTGEASTAYVDPRVASRVAARIAGTLPEARILLLARNPLDRARSHYRHEVQRNRERQPFSIAIKDLENPYVRRSLYFAGLEPYIRTFDQSRLKVIRTEDLSAPGHPGWRDVLTHLQLPQVDPGPIENPTAPKAQFTRLARRLWDAGYLQALDKKAPRQFRRLGRRLTFRRGPTYDRLLASAVEPH